MVKSSSSVGVLELLITADVDDPVKGAASFTGPSLVRATGQDATAVGCWRIARRGSGGGSGGVLAADAFILFGQSASGGAS